MPQAFCPWILTKYAPSGALAENYIAAPTEKGPTLAWPLTVPALNAKVIGAESVGSGQAMVTSPPFTVAVGLGDTNDPLMEKGWLVFRDRNGRDVRASGRAPELELVARDVVMAVVTALA